MSQWILVSLFALAILGMSWGLIALNESGARGRAYKYRDLFERLIFDLERLVIRANALSHAASQIKDGDLLDHYHSAIKMVETLLLAVKKLRSYGEDCDLLQAPVFLAKDISERLTKIENAMQKSQKGKPHEFLKVAPAMAHNVIGCHFCSRPFDAHLFGKVRVKIDGRSEEVASCHYCRERLLSTRKARVLFFSENGVQIHWSKAKAWTPSPEYWSINRDDVTGNNKAPHLELIYSNVSHIRPPDLKK